MANLLLDTTVIIDFLRKDKKAIEYLSSLSSPTISIITEGEIYEGAISANELKILIKTLSNFTILPITEEISILGIGLLRQYRLSHGLHILDAIIAATATCSNLILKTGNYKNFQFIKDLQVEKW